VKYNIVLLVSLLKIHNIHMEKYVGCQWLAPIILATQEAEIRRITVQSQPRQTVQETLSRKKSIIKKLMEWLKM
jgi:hypothetical protein